MTNKEIARALRETAALIELTGGNRFRANAFSRAARTLRGIEQPVVDLAEEGALTEIDGIGDGLSEQIGELIDRGSFDLRDELLNAVPPGLLDVLRVKGLGTKKVRTLWQELDVTSLDDLEDAAETDRVRQLSGFGKKTQENILENVARLRAYRARRRYDEALRTARRLHEHVSALDAVERVVFSGELRRKLETVSAIDMVAAAPSPDAVADALRTGEALPYDVADVAVDDAVVTVPLNAGIPLRLHVSPPERFGTVLWETTGSDAHCEALVDDHGMPGDHPDEEAVFAEAGAEVIPPELREGDGEWEAAREDALPDLIQESDLRGSLHNHSTYSDGANTLRQMAEAARSLGLSYFGICDHSQSLTVAGGMTPDEVRAQQDEIRDLNDAFAHDDGGPFRIFSGIESDILADGTLDYEDDVLASFDFVVASVHSRFNMTIDEATDRLITAVSNPYTTILGHPTGRLLLEREGYPVDHGRVINACAEHGVAIELNANPYRLDLDWRYVKRAIERGVLISINPDAHATGELENVRWGIEVARKGWLTANNCLNAKSLDDFAEWLDARAPAHAG